LLALALSCAACAGLLDLSDVEYGGSDAGGIDGPSALPEASADVVVAPTYHDIADAGFWESVDLANIRHEISGFNGGAFDGKRYLYLVPGGNISLVARYDVGMALDQPDSWRFFDVRQVADVGGLSKAAYDGRYLYFSPNVRVVAARYDTQSDFEDAGSWTAFALGNDAGVVPGSEAIFNGAIHDGTGIVFVPSELNSGSSSYAVRYETDGDFQDAASWTGFAVAGGPGFAGGVAANGAVYLAPYAVAARWQTDKAFDDPDAWAYLKPSELAPEANVGPFTGAVFDGRRVWYVPNATSTVVGYDTLRPFDGKGSWAFVPIAPELAPDASGKAYGTFNGGAFDGRFVYFAPADGRVIRFEVADQEDASVTWSSFDTTSLADPGDGYRSAVFDGRYVTFINPSRSTLVRFDARSPPAVPSFVGSSFF
jgi:hypothetical protein